MTYKEAIEILKPLFEQCKGKGGCLGYIEHYFSKDEEKALDLAIKALEERSQGEWVGDTDYESYQGNYEAYKCNKCGYCLHWRDYYANKYNFCPNSGADMREGKS